MLFWGSLWSTVSRVCGLQVWKAGTEHLSCPLRLSGAASREALVRTGEVVICSVRIDPSVLKKPNVTGGLVHPATAVHARGIGASECKEPGEDGEAGERNCLADVRFLHAPQGQ